MLLVCHLGQIPLTTPWSTWKQPLVITEPLDPYSVYMCLKLSRKLRCSCLPLTAAWWYLVGSLKKIQKWLCLDFHVSPKLERKVAWLLNVTGVSCSLYWFQGVQSKLNATWCCGLWQVRESNSWRFGSCRFAVPVTSSTMCWSMWRTDVCRFALCGNRLLRDWNRYVFFVHCWARAWWKE